MVDLRDITEFVSAGKGAVDLLKSAMGLLPAGPDRDEIQRKVQAAEDALARGDAKLASELGYELCRCTFPPQPMLSEGYHEVHGIELFRCPKCSKQHPSEHTLRQYDAVKEHNERARNRKGWGRI